MSRKVYALSLLLCHSDYDIYGICTAFFVIKCAGGDFVEMTDKERRQIEELFINLLLRLLYDKGKIGAPTKDGEQWAKK